MKRLFSRLFDAVRASYWFLPSVMAVLAIVLGAVMVWLDAGPGTGLLSELGWYQKAKPDGAHQVLSTIAGSMITVAGVVFSITIVAIAYAASQYGPRILTNFMSDRGNQVTLGTFIATFVYCLVVLRTIRGGDGDAQFVPQMAVMVGLLLALCSIAVFIYFIHHVPNSIHINNVVAQIGRQLIDGVQERFPAFIGDRPEDHDGAVEPSLKALAQLRGEAGETASVCSQATGYIQGIDDEALLQAATEHDLVVRLRHQPGDYIHSGRIIIEAWPPERLTDEAAEDLRDSYSIGSGRTPYGDLTFLVDELVEIGARALSSGVNDPYTAMTCLDWLGAGASEMASRRFPSPQRVDEEGVVRVLARPQTFAGFIRRGFGGMRQYVARDMNAAVHALLTMGAVAESCRSVEAIEALESEIAKLKSLYRLELQAAALDRVEEEAEDVEQMLSQRRKLLKDKEP
ncbi:MAG TPA: DUF2254 domain-containing protein [Allosphingosinicella sp.]|nr:DUF2254 domain-containing protein [Allosphingosinicella sp.]